MKSKFIYLSLIIVLASLFQACEHFTLHRKLCNSFSGKWTVDNIKYKGKASYLDCAPGIEAKRGDLVMPLSIIVEEPVFYTITNANHSTLSGRIDLFPDSLILMQDFRPLITLHIEQFDSKKAIVSSEFFRYSNISNDSLHICWGSEAIIYLSRQ